MEHVAGNLNFGVIGAGLIGGSITKSLLQKAQIDSIIVLDSDPFVRPLVEAVGATWAESIEDVVVGSDIVFVAVPQGCVEEVFCEMDQVVHLRDGMRKLLVTDVGAEKTTVEQIFMEMPSLSSSAEFIPGHPMSGTEFNGFQASFPELFENAVWVLCDGMDYSENSLYTLLQVILSMGARISVLDAILQDDTAALISHLPYLVAATVSNVVGQSPNLLVTQRLAAGSYGSVTRVALSPAEMSTGMITANHNAVRKVTDRFAVAWETIVEAVNDNDRDAVYSMFDAARNHKKTYLNSKETKKTVEVLIPFGELKNNLKEFSLRGGVLEKIEKNPEGFLVHIDTLDKI